MAKLEGMEALDRERLWPQLVQGFKDLSDRLKVLFCLLFRRVTHGLLIALARAIIWIFWTMCGISIPMIQKLYNYMHFIIFISMWFKKSNHLFKWRPPCEDYYSSLEICVVSGLFRNPITICHCILSFYQFLFMKYNQLYKPQSFCCRSLFILIYLFCIFSLEYNSLSVAWRDCHMFVKGFMSKPWLLFGLLFRVENSCCKKWSLEFYFKIEI